MQEPRLPQLPTDTDLLDALLRSPGLFALAEEEISALRVLKFRTSSTMMDISLSIQKAELLYASQPENADTANNADAIIADQMAAAVSTRAKANSELVRILGPSRYRQAFRAVEEPRKDPPVTTVKDAERPAKDQKAVEIETAVMVAERLVSWAKLFAWVFAGQIRSSFS